MIEILCRGRDYYGNGSTTKSERVSMLSGMTMSGSRLDGSDSDYGFSSRKSKPLTKKEIKATRKAFKLDAARALLKEAEAEEEAKEEIAAQAKIEAKAKAKAIADAKELIAEADAPILSLKEKQKRAHKKREEERDKERHDKEYNTGRDCS